MWVHTFDVYDDRASESVCTAVLPGTGHGQWMRMNMHYWRLYLGFVVAAEFISHAPTATTPERKPK